jgi:hypothetical protein
MPGDDDLPTTEGRCEHVNPGQRRPRRKSQRRTYCPVCGQEQVARAEGEAAFCSRRCANAWQALVAVRAREGASVELAKRRHREFTAGATYAPVLSELLLKRWRAGDWTLAPESLLARL